MQELQETQVWSMSWIDPLEEGMATHSSIRVYIEEPGRLQSMGSQRVEQDWSDFACTHAHRLPVWARSLSYWAKISQSNISIWLLQRRQYGSCEDGRLQKKDVEFVPECGMWNYSRLPPSKLFPLPSAAKPAEALRIFPRIIWNWSMDVYGSIWDICCAFWKGIETCLSFQWDTQNLWLIGHVLGGRWWSSYQLIIDVCGWKSNGCGPEDNVVCVCVCVCVCVFRCFSPVWLFVTLWTVAHQAPLSMGFSWQESWSCSSTRRVRGCGRWEGLQEGGNLCIPTAYSCQYKAKTITIL